MPIERRIREGAERNASVLDPDVDRFLDSVVHGDSSSAGSPSLVSAAISLMAVSLIVVVGPGLVRGIQDVDGGATPGGDPSLSVAPAPPLLTGTFTRSIPEGTAVVRVNGIAGTWTIRATADGTTRLLAPEAFVGARASRPFELQATTLRTDALGSDVCAGLPAGTYSWSVHDGFLLISAVSDPCDARIVILTAKPWKTSS